MSHLTVILKPANVEPPPPESNFSVSDSGNLIDLFYFQKGKYSWGIQLSNSQAYELGTALITVARP